MAMPSEGDVTDSSVMGSEPVFVKVMNNADRPCVSGALTCAAEVARMDFASAEAGEVKPSRPDTSNVLSAMRALIAKEVLIAIKVS